ncbi:MAG: cytochrome c [Acidobacteriales bacterium]|nr:cytochrome c [Terriglobales bacterium]
MRPVANIYLLLAAFLLAGCGKTEKPRRPLTAQEQRGERVYQANCAQCHGTAEIGPTQGPAMTGLYSKPYLPSGAPANDERVTEVIKQGKRMMPGYARTLDDAQVADLVAYLKTQ